MTDIIFSMIPAGLVVWIPVLIVIGYLLKHGTGFPNGFIALLLFAISFAVSALYGIGETEGMAGALRVTEILLAYGLGYGFLLAVCAVFLYDAVHGALKQMAGRRNDEAAENDAGATEAEGYAATSATQGEMEMSTETTETTATADVAERKKRHRITSFLANLLVVLCSVVIGTLMSLPWGIGNVLDFISNAVFLAVVMSIVGDAAYKLRFERYKAIWQYWVGLLLALVADWCFLWAAMSTTWGVMAVALGLMALLGFGAGAWFWLVYRRKVAAIEAEYAEEFKDALIEKGVDEETAAEIAEAAAAKEEE